LVLVDLVASAYLTATVPLPVTVPDYALQAAAVYRLEVGAVCFIVVYLAAMAFFLALDGRGFAELGTRGLKAAQIIRAADDDEQETLAEQIEVNQNLEGELEDVKADLQSAIDDINRQEDRLLEIEAQTIS
jgi:hypothetical protein